MLGGGGAYAVEITHGNNASERMGHGAFDVDGAFAAATDERDLNAFAGRVAGENGARQNSRQRDKARATDSAVHEHPYGAMGIAAAVGLLIGFLAARR